MNLTNYLRKYIKKYTSQNGEEGIIEHILKKIYKTDDLKKVSDLQLCEIGSGDGFFLSNSYYFIKKYKFKALMVEADNINVENSKKRFEKDDVIHENEFVDDKKSIDYFLSKHNFKTDIDFLSIDIDGQDYHLFKKIKISRPKIILIESNMTMDKDDIIYEKENMQCGIGSSPSALLELAKSKQYKLCLQLFNNLIFVDNKYFSKLEFADNFIEEEEIHDAFPIKCFQDHFGNVHLIHNGPWKFNKVINYFPNKQDDSGGVNQVDFQLNLNNKNASSNIFKNFEIKVKSPINQTELENFRNFTRDAQKGLNTFLFEPFSLQNNTEYFHEVYRKTQMKEENINILENNYILKKIHEINLSKAIFFKYAHLQNLDKRIALQKIAFKIFSHNSHNFSKLIRINIIEERMPNPIEFQIKNSEMDNLSTVNTSQIFKKNLYIFIINDFDIGNLYFNYMSAFNKVELNTNFINTIEVFDFKKIKY